MTIQTQDAPRSLPLRRSFSWQTVFAALVLFEFSTLWSPS